MRQQQSTLYWFQLQFTPKKIFRCTSSSKKMLPHVTTTWFVVVFHSSHAMAVFQISRFGTTIDPTSCGWTISQEALGATDSWYAEVRNLAKFLVTSRQTLDCVPHSYFKIASTGEANMAWGRRKQHKTKTDSCYFDVCRSMALWKAGQWQANMSWLHLCRDGYYCPQSHPNYCCSYKTSCILLSCPAKFFWNAECR